MIAKAALLAASVLALTGCGAASVANKPQPSPTKSSAPKPSSSPTSTSSTSPVLPCQDPAMTAILGSGAGSYAGRLVYVVPMTNTGTQSCTLDGYPTVTLMVGTSPITTNQTDGNDGIAEVSNTPTLVTVAPGASASFVLQWSDVPTDNDSCPASNWLQIQLPQQTVGILVDSGTITACGGDIYTSPLQAGTSVP